MGYEILYTVGGTISHCFEAFFHPSSLSLTSEESPLQQVRLLATVCAECICWSLSIVHV